MKENHKKFIEELSTLLHKYDVAIEATGIDVDFLSFIFPGLDVLEFKPFVDDETLLEGPISSSKLK